VKDLNAAFYPAKQIVPYLQIVHDRIALEIMRGCKHACKFCQATSVYRPWRERSKETVTALAQEACRMTGYDEISLLSLSSGDHSQIKEILETLNGVFKDKGVSVSVPSLRVEDILTKLPVLLSEVKKSGLTFAPEAGTDCLRKFLNKDIDINKLLEGAEEAFKAGWKRVKLYFMIGLPTEREEDLAAIADLIYAISDLKRKVDGRNAYIAASVNAFVPKPHTPFQWEAMETVEALARKQGVIKGRIRSRFVELSFNGLEMSYTEALFSRGDRRLAPVILEAWKAGSRFDGWKDHFRFGIWAEALKKCGVEGDFYVTRPRRREEALPWDFIRLHA